MTFSGRIQVVGRNAILGSYVLQCALGHQWTLTQADEEILLTGGRQAPVHAIRCRACERLARAAAALRWDDPDVLRTPGGAE